MIKVISVIKKKDYVERVDEKVKREMNVDEIRTWNWKYNGQKKVYDLVKSLKNLVEELNGEMNIEVNPSEFDEMNEVVIKESNDKKIRVEIDKDKNVVLYLPIKNEVMIEKYSWREDVTWVGKVIKEWEEIRIELDIDTLPIIEKITLKIEEIVKYKEINKDNPYGVERRISLILKIKDWDEEIEKTYYYVPEGNVRIFE